MASSLSDSFSPNLNDQTCLQSSTILKEILTSNELIGKGGYKRVYGCTNNKCNKILAVITLSPINPQEEDSPETIDDLNEANYKIMKDTEKEVNYNNFIWENDNDKYKLRPRLVIGPMDMTICIKSSRIFIEQVRARSDLSKYGKIQFDNFFKTVGLDKITTDMNSWMLLKKSEVEKIFYIARELYDRYKMIHGDLKPENILVDSKDNFFLADFGFSGFAKSAESDQPPTQGSTQYYGCDFSVPSSSNSLEKDLFEIDPQLDLTFFNQFQLDIELMYRNTLVVDDVELKRWYDNKSSDKTISLKMFTPHANTEKLRKKCLFGKFAFAKKSFKARNEDLDELIEVFDEQPKNSNVTFTVINQTPIIKERKLVTFAIQQKNVTKRKQQDVIMRNAPSTNITHKKLRILISEPNMTPKFNNGSNLNRSNQLVPLTNVTDQKQPLSLSPPPSYSQSQSQSQQQKLSLPPPPSFSQSQSQSQSQSKQQPPSLPPPPSYSQSQSQQQRQQFQPIRRFNSPRTTIANANANAQAQSTIVDVPNMTAEDLNKILRPLSPVQVRLPGTLLSPSSSLSVSPTSSNSARANAQPMSDLSPNRLVTGIPYDSDESTTSQYKTEEVYLSPIETNNFNANKPTYYEAIRSPLTLQKQNQFQFNDTKSPARSTVNTNTSANTNIYANAYTSNNASQYNPYNYVATTTIPKASAAPQPLSFQRQQPPTQQQPNANYPWRPMQYNYFDL
jgi:serine/threonine protein kinase